MKHRLALVTLIAGNIALHALAGEARAESIMESQQLRIVTRVEDDSIVITSRTSEGAVPVVARLADPMEGAAAAREIDDPLWGRGQEVLIKQLNGWTTTLRLFQDHPFLQIHTRAFNLGQQPLVTSSIELLKFDVDLGLPPERLRFFGSGFLHGIADAPGSFTFAAVVDPDTRHGVVAAYLTHECGSGVFWAGSDQQKVSVRTRLDCGRYQVDAGQARATDTLLLGYFDDARLGLEAYASAVAKHYAISLPPQPSVYCTWYHAGASDEVKLIDNAQFAAQHLKPFGFSVMQIDDLWQKRLPTGVTYDGDIKDLDDGGPVKVFVESNERYPAGMKAAADKVNELGLVPGIWFMPFAGNWKNPYFADRQQVFARWPEGTPVTTRWSGTMLDMSNPVAQQFVFDRVKRIADWGYGYFKLDGMHTGAVTHNVYVNTGYATSGPWLNSRNFVGDQQAGPGAKDEPAPSQVLHDPHMTHIEAYRKGLQIVRQAAGPHVFILGCNVSQNMRSMGPAFGLIDAMRIGPDNGGAAQGEWGQVLLGARHGSNLYFLNRRVWHNDPDPVYVRPSNPLNAARVMVSWVAVTGSMLSVSYQFSELPADRLELLKRCMPSHNALVRPVDLFESDPPRIWLTQNDRVNIIGLFNWNENDPVTIEYDMQKLGLERNQTYVAFDYWDDAFVPSICGTLKADLPPGACRILALRPQCDHPQLLSTSRHITQGIVDVIEESWDASTRTLRGRSRVVIDDPYEVRLAWPSDGSWQPGSASADGAAIRLRERENGGLRAVIDQATKEEIRWEITF